MEPLAWIVLRLGAVGPPGNPAEPGSCRGRYHTDRQARRAPHITLREVQGGCLWPVGQITCRHERDLEAYSQLSRVLGQLCAVIDDAAQTAIVALVVPLDQEIHPVGEVL